MGSLTSNKDDADDDTPGKDIPGGPTEKHQRAFDEWMALFLLNWVLIGMIVFYGIVMGGLTGVLYAVVLERLLTDLGVVPGYFRIYPALGQAAKGLIAVAIVGLTLHSFHHLRYDCKRDHYYLARPGRFFLNLAFRVGAVFLILSVVTLMVHIA